MPPEHIGFVLAPDFALMSAASAVEPLRAANGIAGQDLYAVRFLSPQGGPVRSSSGGYFDTEAFADTEGAFDMLFVVAGGNPFRLDPAPYLPVLRRHAARGATLGGVSGGSVLLARAGLLQGRRFTVHWEHIEPLLEEDPGHLIEKRLFVIDRNRATCAGGVAPLDMMHALIRSRHGLALADQVSDWFIHTHVRVAEASQRLVDQTEHRLHPAVASTIRMMRDHIAEPMPLSRLARLVGLSQRQLLRHFRHDLGQTVNQYYMGERLKKADELLRQTRLSVTQVAFAAGFSDQSSFSRAFQQRFGVTPKAWRER